MTHREPCACTDYDYECDYGYEKVSQSSSSCVLATDKATWDATSEKRRNEQCEDYGYYEVTQGYRKIPGNICHGGVQLSPQVYYCSAGFVSSLFSWTGIFMMAVCGAVLYYGWPVIEAILIMLPIPDPKMLKDRSIDTLSRGWSYLKGLVGQ